MSRRRSLLASCLALVLDVAVVAPVAAGQVRLRVSASTSQMNFGSLAVGQESAPRALLRHEPLDHPDPLGGNGLSVRSELGWVLGNPVGGVSGMTASCYDLPDSTIQPGQTCALDVFTFKPTVTGAHSLTIGMRFTDGVGVVDLFVTAKGKGV